MNHSTESVCPVCLKKIPAQRLVRDNAVYLSKVCPEHGHFEAPIWSDASIYRTWRRESADLSPAFSQTEDKDNCPHDCGICAGHRQNICCVLLEVTQGCDLNCPVCYASASADRSGELSLCEISDMFDFIMDSGGPYNIQLSGGEPTVRNDLEQIIRLGKSKGLEYFQLNTNGLRLAADPDYAKRLRDAGLSCVFLQFDGLTASVYEAIRGRDILEDKLRCLDNCRAAELGVVLVPTVVRGVNDDQIGAVIDFAFEHLPFVRGVHFQPISYFGRYPESFGARLTLPDVLHAIDLQTHGRLAASDFSPGTAENSYCSFSGSFLLNADGSVAPIRSDGSCCCDASRPKQYVAKQWGAPVHDALALRCVTPKSFEEFTKRTKQYTLSVSCMAFQDAFTMELDRVRQCHICIVTKDRRFIPFCAYNLTSESGETIYRGRAF